jgi:hypothetical protein
MAARQVSEEVPTEEEGAVEEAPAAEAQTEQTEQTEG